MKPTCYSLLVVLALAMAGCGDDSGPTPPTGGGSPPSAVRDLSIVNSTGSAVTLAWTAPSDSESSVASYDIRYASSTLTVSTWSGASRASNEPMPGNPGTTETFVVSGLQETTEYHFALKSTDAAGEVSALSNVVRRAGAIEATWTVLDEQGLSGNPSGYVSGMEWIDGRLTVFGSLNETRGVELTEVASWDGEHWVSMGHESFWRPRDPLIYDGSAYCVEGELWVWNGSGWSPIGEHSGRGYIEALIVYDGGLVAGGSGEIGGSVPGTSGIASWDGSSWQAVGSGPPDCRIFDLAVHQGELYAAGEFDLGEGFVDAVMRWNGSDWTVLGAPLDDAVSRIVVHNSELYIGGHFVFSEYTELNKIARWDGSKWSALGSGVPQTKLGGRVIDLASYRGTLIVTGERYGAFPILWIWDGARWRTLPGLTPYPGLVFQGQAAFVHDDTLYLAVGAVPASGAPRSFVYRLEE